MRDGLTSRQLCAALFAGLTVPLALVGARLHWRWVLLAELLAGLYYYIMYRTKRDPPLAHLALSAFGKPGKALLLPVAAFFVCLAGFAANRSSLSFPQTAELPVTGLVLLAVSALAAKKGIRALVRCGALLCVLLIALYGIVLLGSAPRVQIRWLTPAGDLKQTALFLGILTLPTVCLYFHPEEDNTAPALWFLACGVLALAASLVTAGCLSPKIAAEEMSFYTLAQSVSLFGTLERFEAIISAAFLSGAFCLAGLFLCAAREVLFVLLPQDRASRLPLFAFAAPAALFSGRIPLWVWACGAAIFCGIFPVLTQGIVGLKKEEKISEKTGKKD